MELEQPHATARLAKTRRSTRITTPTNASYNFYLRPHNPANDS
jgi:hypothetical protein